MHHPLPSHAFRSPITYCIQRPTGSRCRRRTRRQGRRPTKDQRRRRVPAGTGVNYVKVTKIIVRERATRIGAAEQRGAREACETWITRTPRDMSRRQDTFTCLSPLRFHMHTEHHHTCRELELGVSVCVWGNDVYIYTHTPPTWHTHHTPSSPVCVSPQLSRGAKAASGQGTRG